MAVKLHQHSFVSSSSSNPWLSRNSIRTRISCRRGAGLDYLLSNCGNARKRNLLRLAMLEKGNYSLNHHLVGCRKIFANYCKSRRMGHFLLLASSDDGVTVNGSPQASTSTNVEKLRVKLNQSLQGKDYCDGLVQSLHDAARVFELAIKEQGSLSNLPWLSTAWLGVDRNAWIKALSYQASAYSLLQAASEISSRGDDRDRDTYVFVQRSLLRQSAPLESLIRDKLSAKQPEAYEWFWSELIPVVVTSFVNYFEEDQRFAAATALTGKGLSLGSGNASDISLLMLALTCIAAITKLGPAKVSCSQFFSMIPDITGRLMDMLVDIIPIREAYYSVKDIGLGREFLVHFGPRASTCRVKNDRGSEEVIFWVDLVQELLQRAIDREKIWSRLTTSESIEVLERDLAIFGFFIALGRSTQSFLSVNGFDVIDDPLEGFIRYLIGGSVLYYPQLSSISSYQLYVEVVCEELDWLPFYPGNSGTPRQSHVHKSKQEGPPNAEAIPQVLDVCSHWMQSFIKYSKWLENPSNVKAAKFLSRGHNKLTDCMKELGMSKNEMTESTESGIHSPAEKDSDSFDKALESVEEALIRLEKLLQELHLASSTSGKEQLKAACSDLEKIRKLKKETEFLEASFRAKAASLKQGDDDSDTRSSTGEQQIYLKGKKRRSTNLMQDRAKSKSRGLLSFIMRPPTRKPESELSVVDEYLQKFFFSSWDNSVDAVDQTSWTGWCVQGNEYIELTTSNIDVANSECNEIRRFELLRNELIELEKRVQRSADRSENEEDVKVMNDSANHTDEARDTQLVQVQKKENIIEKSIDKLKETSTDVWQGTQLLAIDVAAATVLLRRALVGDELTEKEKQALRRTLTDLASVVPIGVLMLLPVKFLFLLLIFCLYSFFFLISLVAFNCLIELLNTSCKADLDKFHCGGSLGSRCLYSFGISLSKCHAPHPGLLVTAVGHAAMLAAIQRYVPALIPSTYGPERLDLLRQLDKVKEMETSEVDPDENVGEVV
ncbi:hypothetical protein Pint_36101 [Pistacia integerrima]|uniref:Uncharacterized protein n=1 Tax=Pistacia integerrima TaxID=434235 RepID=A0ACC0Y1P2_9ROSI|nr:hypothetical protein Pint_36101 [Pistacia integerrima]